MLAKYKENDHFLHDRTRTWVWTLHSILTEKDCAASNAACGLIMSHAIAWKWALQFLTAYWPMLTSSKTRACGQILSDILNAGSLTVFNVLFCLIFQ